MAAFSVQSDSKMAYKSLVLFLTAIAFSTLAECSQLPLPVPGQVAEPVNVAERFKCKLATKLGLASELGPLSGCSPPPPPAPQGHAPNSSPPTPIPSTSPPPPPTASPRPPPPPASFPSPPPPPAVISPPVVPPTAPVPAPVLAPLNFVPVPSPGGPGPALAPIDFAGASPGTSVVAYELSGPKLYSLSNSQATQVAAASLQLVGGASTGVTSAQLINFQSTPLSGRKLLQGAVGFVVQIQFSPVTPELELNVRAAVYQAANSGSLAQLLSMYNVPVTVVTVVYYS